jgi:hypothetical protein
MACRLGRVYGGFHKPPRSSRPVTSTYRYKRPPRKRKAVPLPSPAVVRKVKPCNDNRPDVVPQNKSAAIVRTAQSSRAMHNPPEDNPQPAIVTTTSQKRRISDGPPLPMELPLSRKPIERDGDDYKRMKATMARRLRGE